MKFSEVELAEMVWVAITVIVTGIMVVALPAALPLRTICPVKTPAPRPAPETETESVAGVAPPDGVTESQLPVLVAAAVKETVALPEALT